MTNLKKAIVVDWLDVYGGAERVIGSLCRTFRFEKCYTLINVMNKEDQSKVFKEEIPIVQTRLSFFRKRFRIVFPIFHYFLNKINISTDTDVIISSSHAVAKGVKKSRKDQIHISYFQARNQKYIWEDSNLYFGKFSFITSLFVKRLRKIDIKNAQKPDFIISNSIFVQKWVKEKYDRESTVIYPPVDISRFSLETQKEDFYVAVGRIEPYKRFDLVVEAFNVLKKPLVIIGDGSLKKDLEKIAHSNITFKGYLDSAEVFNYISKAKGFVHGGIEDFGIAPIEAQACGTPVIAYGEGGVLETVVHNKTGLFFNSMNIESIVDTIEIFENTKFAPKEIRKNAERFSTEIFEKKMQKYTTEKTLNWNFTLKKV